MARPLRIEYPGAWYHVMNRGAGRKWVFKSDIHREAFLDLLAESAERFALEIHAYCLMGNHYHLLVRTPSDPLSRVMRHIDGLYTQRFNRDQRRDGPLFRGRYRALLVDADSYWLQVSRYVHRNPLEAGVVERSEDYPWSSYRAYLGMEKAPSWLFTGAILSVVGRSRARQRYRSYVEEGVDEETAAFFGNSRQAPILGDESFVKRVLAGRPPASEVPEQRRAGPRPSAEQVLAAVAERFEVGIDSIRSSRRGRGALNLPRQAAMYLCQHSAGMPLARIAEAFGLSHYAGVASSIRNFKQRMSEDRPLATQVNTLMQDLTP